MCTHSFILSDSSLELATKSIQELRKLLGRMDVDWRLSGVLKMILDAYADGRARRRATRDSRKNGIEVELGGVNGS
jgi:hypothetical protein